MKKDCREQELTSKEVGKEIVQESEPELEKRGQTVLYNVGNRMRKADQMIPNNAVKQSKRGLQKEGEI